MDEAAILGRAFGVRQSVTSRDELPATGHEPVCQDLPLCYVFLMRTVVQRVSRASVKVGGELVGEIGLGLLVLLAVARDDTEGDADYLADKIAGLRIFEDADGKMNRAVADAGGAVLAVSQFTLYGDVRRGKRPSFDAAARPEQAMRLYEYFVGKIRAAGLRCETGKFQETMVVAMVNDGPVTILLDSKKTF
jgi:D-aminoacyl-tRNA deacylase